MADLVEPDAPQKDGSFLLPVYIYDRKILRKFTVRGDLYIGAFMLQIVQEVDPSYDWSDHALRWPDKRILLNHTRSTLHQLGITAEDFLQFAPMNGADIR